MTPSSKRYSNTTKYFLIALIALLSLVIIFSGCFASGFAVGNNIASKKLAARPISPQDTTSDDRIKPIPEPDDFDTFWKTMQLVKDNYDGDVPQGRIITFAAIEGLLTNIESCDTNADNSSGEIIQITGIKSPKEAPNNFDFFWTTVNQLYRDCPDAMPEPDELVYLAANGVIKRLGDRFTLLLDPKVAEDFRIDMESSFEGIGAVVQPSDMDKGIGVKIVNPFENSPAAKAGLKEGDEILAVDGKDVTKKTIDEAVHLIRGPAGSQVTLTVKRDTQEPFDVTITRAKVEIPVVESKMLDNNIFYVKLNEFSAPSADKLEEALKQGQKEGAKAIIFDLRGNPGGRLDMAIRIASMFIKDGVIVKETGKRNMSHMAEGGLVVPPDMPVAVLVNGGSASASEIVAGALQDYGRAILIGEQTFGKGSVQTLFDLPDGAMLRVTSAHWFTPKDRGINGQGLRPDLVVSPSVDGKEDLQLDAAIQYLQKQLNK